MISMASAVAFSEVEAILTVPLSCTSMVTPAFSWMARMVLPPEPMTSRMRSTAILMVVMRGA